MSDCSNCFNGCGTPTSDKCVKYTGVDQPSLNIEFGDTLLSVEEKIIIKILEISMGLGVFPNLSLQDVCTQMKDYLPLKSTLDLNDWLYAIIQTACANGTAITTINTKLSALNSAYTMGCVTGVAPADQTDTHKVLQALITNFCTLQTSVNTINNSLSSYVKIADINGYIDAYITSKSPGNLVSNKMIAYTVIEYYGPLSNFSASGSGLDLTLTGGLNWTKVYLCNGDNGTPDKRGRVPVGVTGMPGTKPLDDFVKPGQGTPDYGINDDVTKLGSNTTTLTILQLPSHDHDATSTIGGVTNVPVPFLTQLPGPPTPTGSILTYDSVGDEDGAIRIIETAVVNTSLTTVTTDVKDRGGDQPHSNIQPVLPCYYIMYRP